MLFTSYYDGSLESYNNDFVDQVAWVLNTVFGQQAGYPRTRWMVQDGAHNERWFKNFIRGHQVPTQVWYSAYPDLAAVTIDQNARLRRGPERRARGRGLSWLRHGLRIPGPGAEVGPEIGRKRAVDTDDIQGLVLQGYGKLRAAAYVVLELTDGAQRAVMARRRCSRRSPSAARGPGSLRSTSRSRPPG